MGTIVAREEERLIWGEIRANVHVSAATDHQETTLLLRNGRNVCTELRRKDDVRIGVAEVAAADLGDGFEHVTQVGSAERISLHVGHMRSAHLGCGGGHAFFVAKENDLGVGQPGPAPERVALDHADVTQERLRDRKDREHSRMLTGRCRASVCRRSGMTPGACGKVGLMEDWRLMGQERFLHGASFRHKSYRAYRTGWDHDHCEFCTRKLVEAEALSDYPDAASLGYAAVGRGPGGEDDYYWVCDDCFPDFREQFEWTVIQAEG
ncbi:MAG TPA: hypothetical protein VFW85_04315 [Gaiellaceae bacterium]|nr:hypothetical protein [Gaiellaceae bacterium]